MATTLSGTLRRMTAAQRQTRATSADELCREAYAASAGPVTGVALVAVGGYGRGELAPALRPRRGPRPRRRRRRSATWAAPSGTRCGTPGAPGPLGPLDAPDARGGGRPAGRAGAARRPAPGRRPRPQPAAAHHDARRLAPPGPHPAAGPQGADPQAPRGDRRARPRLRARRQGGRGRPARRRRAQGDRGQLAGRRLDPRARGGPR